MFHTRLRATQQSTHNHSKHTRKHFFETKTARWKPRKLMIAAHNRLINGGHAQIYRVTSDNVPANKGGSIASLRRQPSVRTFSLTRSHAYACARKLTARQSGSCTITLEATRRKRFPSLTVPQGTQVLYPLNNHIFVTSAGAKRPGAATCMERR